MDLSTKLPKKYANLKTKLKHICKLHFPLNMTNSTSYSIS